jgi:hypothetical protein
VAASRLSTAKPTTKRSRACPFRITNAKAQHPSPSALDEYAERPGRGRPTPTLREQLDVGHRVGSAIHGIARLIEVRLSPIGTVLLADASWPGCA